MVLFFYSYRGLLGLMPICSGSGRKRYQLLLWHYREVCYNGGSARDFLTFNHCDNVTPTDFLLQSVGGGLVE